MAVGQSRVLYCENLRKPRLVSVVFLFRTTDISMETEQTFKPINSLSCLKLRPNREQLLCRTFSLWSWSAERAALSCTTQADKSKSISVPYFQPAQSKTRWFVPNVNAADGDQQLSFAEDFFQNTLSEEPLPKDERGLLLLA